MKLLMITVSAVALACASTRLSHAAPADIVLIRKEAAPASPQPQSSPSAMQVQFQGQEQSVMGIVTKQVGRVTIQVLGIVHIPSRAAQEGQIQVIIPLPGT